MSYEIIWRNLIAGNLLKDALEQVESIHKDLKRLVELENQGKIRGYNIDISPSIQGIEILDPFVEPELREIELVCYSEFIDEEENEE